MNKTARNLSASLMLAAGLLHSQSLTPEPRSVTDDSPVVTMAGLSPRLKRDLADGRAAVVHSRSRICVASETIACKGGGSSFQEVASSPGERATSLTLHGEDGFIVGLADGNIWDFEGGQWKSLGRPREGAVAGTASLASGQIVAVYRESAGENDSLSYVRSPMGAWLKVDMTGNFVLEFAPETLRVRTDVGEFFFSRDVWISAEQKTDATTAGIQAAARIGLSPSGPSAQISCTISLSTTKIEFSGAYRDQVVNYRSNCVFAVGSLITAKPSRWATTSSATLPVGSGSFHISADPADYQGRLGFFIIGGTTIELVQWGSGPGSLGSCYPTISGSSIQLPPGGSFSATGGTYRLQTSAINQCRYTLTTSDPGMTPLDRLLSQGIGNNVHQITVTRNTTGQNRSAVIETNWGTSSSSTGRAPQTVLTQSAR